MKHSTITSRKTGIFTRLAVERSEERLFFHTVEGHQWLTEALRIALITSIASVSNLSIKPDVWFILIDETLPDSFENQIKKAFSTVKNVTIKIVRIKEWAVKSQTVLNQHDQFQDCEIQVRLDYDDMLRRDFLETLISETKDISLPTILSPQFGIVLDSRTPKMAIIKKTLPPFLVLVRTDRNDQTNIFSYPHDSWPSHMVREIDGNPLWLQSITGRNLENTFGRGWMVSQVRHLYKLNLEAWNGLQVTHRSSRLRTMTLNILEQIKELIPRDTGAQPK